MNGFKNALYSAALYLLMPWALCHLLWRGLRYPPYLQRWHERFGFVPRVKGDRVIWIHAVSVGEVRTVVPLVEFLLDRYPEHRILMTTMTPTGSEQVEQFLGGRVQHCYVPYDLPGAVRRFLDRIRPSMALIVETEFWPNIFRICDKRSIPLFLVNVRVSPRSFRGYRYFPGFTRRMLGRVAMMAVQSQHDAQRLRALGAPDDVMRVTGNLKFDVRIPAELPEGARVLRRQWGESRPVWIAGSTHEGEERMILEAFAEVREAHPSALLVVVPRHPERFGHVTKLCRRGGRQVALRSESRDCDLAASVEILVGDTMGELLDLYAAADVAFVGGSLIPHGGQNLIEALAGGVPVIFGPHMFNFEQSSSIALRNGAAQQIQRDSQLAAAVLAYLDSPELRQRAAEAARHVFDSNHGALQATLEFIEQSTATLGPPVAAPDATPDESAAAGVINDDLAVNRLSSAIQPIRFGGSATAILQPRGSESKVN